MSRAKKVLQGIKKSLKDSNKVNKGLLRSLQKMDERMRAEMVAKIGQQMIDSNKKDGCKG